nr:uncharacterized protein LOC129383126 [Dermacentor andersoni]
MVLRKDATPVVQPARRVPLALREPLREELERMQRSGIIERVQKPTDWTCYQGLQGQRLRTTPTTRKMWRSTRLQSCQPWYDFSHVTSSPEFPRSNGLAEKGVQIVKRILKKTEETKQDFWLGLLNYRSTPLEDGRSPGELLQGRRLRTLLPDFRQQPSIPVFKRAQADTRGRTLPPLNTGDVVRVQEKTWNRRAQVTEAVAPRSYRVVTEDNRVLRRSRQHLLPTGELFQQEALECDDRESERACEALQPTAPAATGDSPVSSENIPQAPPPVTTTGPTVSSTAPQVLTLRRSTRDRRPPQRLRYDRNFNQVLGIYSPQEGRCIGNDARTMPGDSGCPLKPWLLTPVPGHPLTRIAEGRYNTAYAATRSVVERCIGLL